MKRFLPSSVMLIPFVVKHYSDDNDDDETCCDPFHSKISDSQLDLPSEKQSKLEKNPTVQQPKKEIGR